MELMDQLDTITASYGGRLNLAKDSRLSAEKLKDMDGRSVSFTNYREDNGFHEKFSSSQSDRLKL